MLWFVVCCVGDSLWVGDEHAEELVLNVSEALFVFQCGSGLDGMAKEAIEQLTACQSEGD